MKAAVLYEHHAQVEVVDVIIDDVEDFDVLVRIEAAGLCHSELSVQSGVLGFPVPIVLGHEGAGVVEEVGPRVTHVAPGDHVVLNASMSCGRCDYCTSGKPVICRWGLAATFDSRHPDGTLKVADPNGTRLHQLSGIGTLADRTIVNELSVIKIRNDVSFEVAALVGCAVTTGLGAVFNRAKVTPGSTVAVIGVGGVGLNVVQGCRIAGAAQIIAVDPVAHKRSLAMELGATDQADPTVGDPVALVLDLTDGLGVDYAFEAVGFGPLFRQAWDMAGPDGTIVGIGVASKDDTVVLPAQELSLTEKTLMASVYGTSRPQLDMPKYLDMYMAGQLKLDELVSRRYTLDQINDAFHDLSDGLITARGVFSMR